MAHAYSKNEHMPIVRPRLGVRAVGPPCAHTASARYTARSAVGRISMPAAAQGCRSQRSRISYAVPVGCRSCFRPRRRRLVSHGCVRVFHAPHDARRNVSCLSDRLAGDERLVPRAKLAQLLCSARRRAGTAGGLAEAVGAVRTRHAHAAAPRRVRVWRPPKR